MIEFVDSNQSRKFRIDFRYKDRKVIPFAKSEPLDIRPVEFRRYTYCIISPVDRTPEDQDRINQDLESFSHRGFMEFLWVTEKSSYGKARCSKLDTFQREVGRKKSMARALICFSKTTRKAAWNAYLHRKDK